MKKVFNFIFLFIITIVLFTSNKVYAEDKWIGECHYKASEGAEYQYELDIYFNRFRLSSSQNINLVTLNFDIDDILEYYDENKYCPNYLYIHNETSGLSVDWKEETGNYYTRISQKFYPENDTIPDDDTEYYANCYYQLEVISNTTYGFGGKSSDLLNIKYNNNDLVVQVVNSELVEKSGNSILMETSRHETFSDVDINLEQLKKYYKVTESGCPDKIGWDKKDVLFLENDPGEHKNNDKYILRRTDNSTSKNHELNLDGTTIDTTLPEITECSLLLGEPDVPGSPAYYLVKAFDVIKYVALVLLVVLSVMDFTSAAAKQDKDAMAKILKKIMIRFILCIVIFLLPYFIKLLLKYLVERQTDLCGIGGVK